MKNITDLNQTPLYLMNAQLPCPLCIVEDRYAGTYSGASFLAFNMEPESVWQLPVDAGDLNCEAFWNNEDPDFSLEDYVIGKGKSPEEALQDLIVKLEKGGR